MTEFIVLGSVATAASGIAALACLLVTRLIAYKRASRRDAAFAGFHVVGSEEVLDYHPSRYEPMVRLLAGEDLEYLRKHGYLHSASRWTRARRRIVRMYLSDLAGDFHRLHAQARAHLSDSPEQYSEMVGVLMRQQVIFWRAMIVVELRLAFHGCGLGRVDARRLTDAIGAMHAELARMIALPKLSLPYN